ncbi:MAG TPA: glycoside hydrolase family 2 TIM barrel-domain containing protein [Candidatus Aminicenantes bacterium]|nr:glycoside hydrolase family 2 TIM barrel-domain containing protein [Candidatus Aminicenantes bacterium]HRY65900.1 glycoside hydrolase family 2 TIM barrel-domain containing protein [Candidatus Aminicenantes bacterium]HRZ72774.1 glycoside hydrolase family 2 TIM barrel-domain containing protein [Candidatus Aminicenantes bacterium]
MTMKRARSLDKASGPAAIIFLLAVLAAGPAAGRAQYASSMPDRPDPRAKMGPAFETSVNLGDLWYIQSSEKAKGAGEQISSPGFKIEGWYPALVPSTVLGTLVENNVYPDIFFGRNLEKVPTAPFEASWWYRREFTAPVGPGLTRKTLEFDGINYRANIWLNGKLVAGAATVYGAYRRFAIDVTADIKATEKNVLAIEVFPPRPGEPSVGWVDWNPAPPDRAMGLFREVRLRATGDVSIENPFVATKLDLAAFKEARLTVTADLVNHADSEVSGTLEGKIEGLRFSREVTLRPGETRRIELTPEATPELVVKNPRVWWTHDLGKPELYTMALSYVQKKGKPDDKAAPPPPEKDKEKPKGKEPRRLPGMPRVLPSDSRTVRFGIREVADYRTAAGFRGFKLNGRKILVRGGGWTDDLLLDVKRRKLQAEVLYARHMNLNALRLEGFWGTSQDLYDLCDENGILIMVGWSCHWEWTNYFGRPADEPYGGLVTPELMDLAAVSWKDQVLWLRNHPAIFAWAEGSDMIPHPDLERRYIEIMKEIDPTRPALVSAKEKTSEITGPSGLKMRGPYDYVPPVYWYVDKAHGGAFGFNTETGPGPQVPPLESLRRMIPEDKLWPPNDVWDFHCSRGKFKDLKRYTEAMDKRLGPARDLEDYLRKAQFLNYEAMRAMFEAFTVNRYEATGVIQWMYNSAWPKLWWQLYDYFLQPNGAFYGARKAGEPLHILYNYGSQEIAAVGNPTLAAPKLKATIRVLDPDLKDIISKTVEFGLAADEVKILDVLRLPANLPPVYFLDLRLFKEKNQLVDANFYCLSSKPETLDEAASTWYVTPIKDFADLTALNNLRPVTLKVGKKTAKDGPLTRITVELTNPSPDLALMAEIRILREASGQDVLPVFLDDNYVSLLPGETRKISGLVLTEDLGGEEAVVKVRGWNVLAAEK